MFTTTLRDLIHSNDFFSSLDVISDNEGRTISVIPFGSLNNLVSLLSDRIISNRKANFIESNNGTSLFNLISFDRLSGKQKSSGEFILYKLPNFSYAYLIITFEESEFFHDDLRPFIKSFYNEIIFPFIKSRDLIKLIDNYKAYNNLSDIKITRASQNIRYHEEQTMSTVTWNNSSLEDAYKWLRENNGWFKSIQFKAFLHGREVSSTFLARNGIVRSDRNFIRVYEQLILPNCTLVENYINLFKNRSRRDNENLDVRPISIEFSDNIFKDIANNKKFIQTLSTLNNTSISVLHGNPYIHLTIVDYNDASTCDLWVLNQNKILIAPQLHCSIISLKRLVRHIYDNYAEGELKNYEI